MCSLSYVIFGQDDSVGILAYLFPSGVSVYNLYLDIAREKGGAG